MLPKRQGDRSVGGREFDRVAHNVQDHPLDFLRVAPAEKLALAQIERQRDALGISLHLERLGTVANHLAERHHRFGQHQRLVLNLAQVQDVIDRGQQPLAVRLQALQIVQRLFRHRADHPAQHVADRIDHRGQRRAQFMRNVGHKLHAHAVMRLQPLHRILERLLGLLADGDIAHKETELTVRVEIHLVHRDLRRERGPVEAFAPCLDQREFFTDKILVDRFDQRIGRAGNQAHHIQPEQRFRLRLKELAGAFVALDHLAGARGDQHRVINALQQLVERGVAFLMLRAPRTGTGARRHPRGRGNPLIHGGRVDPDPHGAVHSLILCHCTPF